MSRERKQKFYIAYNHKNKEIGVFTDIGEYRFAKEQYEKGGKIIKSSPIYSLAEATNKAMQYISTSYNPPMPIEKVKAHKAVLVTNKFISIEELMNTNPPSDIETDFIP